MRFYPFSESGERPRGQQSSSTYCHPYYYPCYGPYHFAGWYTAWAGYAGRYGAGWPPNWPSRGVVPGPFLGEPVRIRPASSERVPAERDQ